MSVSNKIGINEMSSEELRLEIYDRVNAEQEKFIEMLKAMPAEDIIERAYEKVIRDDILTMFDENSFSDSQIKALLEYKKPLAMCYTAWVHSHYSYMDIIRSSVKDFTGKLAVSLGFEVA